jgi:cytoskeletal protein CcmA (bactofilin family)
MKIYKTQKEVEKDIKNGMLIINDDVKFECDISIKASMRVVGNITAWEINAWEINAGNINAWDINAWNITAGEINAENITAWEINAGAINAGDITARNITAWDITAGDILYYAFCSVYQSIKCVSIKANREIHHKPICLDGKLEIKEPEITNPKEI